MNANTRIRRDNVKKYSSLVFSDIGQMVTVSATMKLVIKATILVTLSHYFTTYTNTICALLSSTQ